MKVLAFSDTHTRHQELIGYFEEIEKEYSDIDTLIFAGDMSNSSDIQKNSKECIRFLEWVSGLSYKNVLVTGGNHDFYLTDPKNLEFIHSNFCKVRVFLGESVNFQGKSMYFSPYTPHFYRKGVFQPLRSNMGKYWENLPQHLDLLVTHGPPRGILDDSRGERAGDRLLLKKILEIKPKNHIFGHVHDNGSRMNNGSRMIAGLDTRFYNVSIIRTGKKDLNPPQIIEI